jgi:hypothetical protein
MRCMYYSPTYHPIAELALCTEHAKPKWRGDGIKGNVTLDFRAVCVMARTCHTGPVRRAGGAAVHVLSRDQPRQPNHVRVPP